MTQFARKTIAEKGYARIALKRLVPGKVKPLLFMLDQHSFWKANDPNKFGISPGNVWKGDRKCQKQT